jgi:hypothetical protein
MRAQSLKPARGGDGIVGVLRFHGHRGHGDDPIRPFGHQGDRQGNVGLLAGTLAPAALRDGDRSVADLCPGERLSATTIAGVALHLTGCQG